GEVELAVGIEVADREGLPARAAGILGRLERAVRVAQHYANAGVARREVEPAIAVEISGYHGHRVRRDGVVDGRGKAKQAAVLQRFQAQPRSRRTQAGRSPTC